MWYRHSGEKMVDGISYFCTTRLQSVEEIRKNVGENDITHLYVKDSHRPPVHAIARNAVELRMSGITDVDLSG